MNVWHERRTPAHPWREPSPQKHARSHERSATAPSSSITRGTPSAAAVAAAGAAAAARSSVGAPGGCSRAVSDELPS